MTENFDKLRELFKDMSIPSSERLNNIQDLEKQILNNSLSFWDTHSEDFSTEETLMEFSYVFGLLLDKVKTLEEKVSSLESTVNYLDSRDYSER